MNTKFDSLSKVLAVLMVEEGPSHVDRIARAPSKDLALTYVQEALRDAHSLMGLGREAFKVKAAYDLLREVKAEFLDKDVVALSSVNTYRELREALALIAARAIAIASKLTLRSGKEPEKPEGKGQEISSGSGGA